MNLFIADDNIEFAEFCAKVAALEGWHVTTCHDGSELLAVLKMETEPALVLCDVMMPDVDGIDVIKTLSDPENLFRIRFITGGSMTNAVAARLIGDARDINVGRFLIKPISLADLRAVFAEEAENLRKMALTKR
ncbi:response regulator [Primorskyibacter sp. 2E233]|uniref:response regulator n=1 Tax=Primorskyibacter sp. 2E233 TaxID=3413431 RepID=UPI003BF05850